jgi:ketosteroid isomerase-like protein
MRLHGRTRMLAGSIMSAIMVMLVLIASLDGALVATAKAADGAKATDGPTAANALAAEQEIARVMRDNDADGIERFLADDWAVIAASGGVGEGKSIFADGIKSGYLTRKTFAISEPRVRLYGNVALVTTMVKTSGMFQGKPFEVTERQTDVLHWERGGWKSVLTHETKIDLK